MSKKRIPLRTADRVLSRNLTPQISAELLSILSQDDSFEAEYLSRMLLSKYTELDSASARIRASRAIDKWLQTESTNNRTNSRVFNLGHSTGDLIPGVSIRKFLDKVSSIIATILPDVPRLDLSFGGFSGGASTSKKRAQGHPALKFLDAADATRPAYSMWSLLSENTRWADHWREVGLEPNFVEGNVLFTVPKNSEIDRVACKEPDLNMFLQRMLGKQIRSNLMKVGVNLNDQRVNQKLAREGSIFNRLMTIDLSSASDSVTTELVRRLMPPAWFHAMNCVRSPLTFVNDEWHINSMFSSMGNGFTFELESLLFYSITRAVSYFTGVRGRVSVYGDDIIAPAEISDELISALCFCGFSVNESKSFVDGPFRESCGKHWYAGRDVSPIFLRKPIRTVSDLILFLNQLTSWASRDLGVVDPRYEGFLLKWRVFIPTDLYGGQDVTSRSSLVTGHRARFELYWPQEIIPHSHVGGLLFWLFVADMRGVNTTFDTDGSKPPRFARKRRSRSSGFDLPIFLSEYGG